jgi:hypothetical protein
VVGGDECLTCVLPILYPRGSGVHEKPNLASHRAAARAQQHGFFGGAAASVVALRSDCSASMATPQFEFVPQTLCIENHMRWRTDPSIEWIRERGLVLGKVLAVWSRVVANRSYRPERHYMRGPGPKTLAMIGRQYRAETSEETRGPLPERWLALIHSIDEQEKRGAGTDQAKNTERAFERNPAGPEC